jgi:hypothetical protein
MEERIEVDNDNDQQAVEKVFFLSLRAKRGNLAFNKPKWFITVRYRQA